MNKAPKSVDRLSILDGVVVAVGWVLGPDPKIAVNGVIVVAQVAVRLHRPDVASIYPGGGKQSGFRITAVLPNASFDYGTVRVVFEDGDVLTRSVVSESDRIPQLIGRFDEAVATSCAQTSGVSLIEIGSRARSGNRYRDRFPSSLRYVGVDVTKGPNVDVVADAHTLSRNIKSLFDFAFSISVWEHLLMPWVAAYELNRVLKPEGMAYIQSHPAWPLHDQPWDFFRFSTDAWRGLFNRFTGFEVVDTAYGIEGAVIPTGAAGGALQNIDAQPTFLLSACLVRKIGEPEVDWALDPSSIYDLHYSH